MAGKNLLVASIVLVVLSLVCEIVGYVSSGWEIIYYQSTWTEIFIDMHFGLWYTCTPDGCESGAKDEGSVCIVEVRLAPDKEALVIAQATSSVALVFTVVALVLNSIFIPMFNSRKNVSTAHRTALVVVCFLAGLTALFGTSNYADAQRRLCDDFCLNLVPYSLLIFGVGGILVMIAFILALIDLLLSRNQSDTTNNGYPMQTLQTDHVSSSKQLVVVPTSGQPLSYRQQGIRQQQYYAQKQYHNVRPSGGNVQYVYSHRY